MSSFVSPLSCSVIDEAARYWISQFGYSSSVLCWSALRIAAELFIFVESSTRPLAHWSQPAQRLNLHNACPTFTGFWQRQRFFPTTKRAVGQSSNKLKYDRPIADPEKGGKTRWCAFCYTIPLKPQHLNDQNPLSGRQGYGGYGHNYHWLAESNLLYLYPLSTVFRVRTLYRRLIAPSTGATSLLDRASANFPFSTAFYERVCRRN